MRRRLSNGEIVEIDPDLLALEETEEIEVRPPTEELSM